MHNHKIRTDWDLYYSKQPKTAFITRKLTENRLLALMSRYAPPNPSILELGGANSCFHDALQDKLKPKAYTIVDNNDAGLRKFQQRWPGFSTSCFNINLLKSDLYDVSNHFDIVFSVGLIEHFSPEETHVVVKRHWEKVAERGVVIITYPTPTFLYCLTRAALEWCGMWKFPDERPLKFSEIARSIPKNVKILHRQINWPIFLTQEVVVFGVEN